MDQLWGISISPIPYSELTSVTTFCPTALIKLRNFQTELKTFSCKPGLFHWACMAQKQLYTCPGSTSQRTCALSPMWPLGKLFQAGQGGEDGLDDGLT